MSVTFADLIADVENHLYSFGIQRDKTTTLTAPIGAGDLTLPVAEPRQVDRGLVEIDQELMAVQSVTSTSVTLHPWGRGQRGTRAVAHSAGSRIAASPRFPRSAIAKAIQRSIAAAYPDLYRIKTDVSSVFSPAVVTYPLPADTDAVISVSYELPGPSREWQQIKRYRVNRDADTTDFPTGKSIDIFDGLMPGRGIRVVYRGGFGVFTDENSTMASIGTQDRWADLVVYGASGNLILGMESFRLESDAVETQERAGSVQPSQATTVARQLLGMYKQRIIEERGLLHRQHPPVITRQF